MAQELSQERRSELAHANQLQVEVMKGLQCGEPVERLLLKALESLALKDNDTVSYPEAKKTLLAIYGDALGEPVPLRIELEEFETRLERLRKAYEEGMETEPKDTQERVKNAIMAHENRIEFLKKKIDAVGAEKPCRPRRFPPRSGRAGSASAAARFARCASALRRTGSSSPAPR